MIRVNKIWSVIALGGMYALTWGFGCDRQDRIEIMVACIFMYLAATQEDVRDMWKGRKP